MGVAQAVVDDEITRRLTPDGVNQVLSSLWAVDCQMCGRSLGTKPPALVVYDMGTHHSALLAHPRCRRSEWSNTGGIQLGSGANLSWHSRALSMPIYSAAAANLSAAVRISSARGTFGTPGQIPDPERMIPTILVNPGLELVTLIRDDAAGTWSVNIDAEFGHVGLRSPGTGLLVDSPVAGAVARLGTSDLAITLTVPPTLTYTAVLDDRDGELRELAAAGDGVMLAMTHAVDPDKVNSPADLRPVLAGDRTIFGWVEFADVRRARPRPAPVPTGRTMLLHYSPQHMAVGPVLAHTTKRHSGAAAKEWALTVINDSNSSAHLIDWTALRDQSGYSTVDAISATQYALRHYPDGWRLTQMLSRTDGSIAETETEARAWAASVLEFREQLTNLPWQPGPTPSAEVITLYAHV